MLVFGLLICRIVNYLQTNAVSKCCDVTQRHLSPRIYKSYASTSWLSSSEFISYNRIQQNEERFRECVINPNSAAVSYFLLEGMRLSRRPDTHTGRLTSVAVHLKFQLLFLECSIQLSYCYQSCKHIRVI